jgi:hypothetical protein
MIALIISKHYCLLIAQEYLVHVYPYLSSHKCLTINPNCALIHLMLFSYLYTVHNWHIKFIAQFIYGRYFSIMNSVVSRSFDVIRIILRIILELPLIMSLVSDN